jgi:hypothetical protein
MNMYAPAGCHGELWRQAEVARNLGSPFVGAVLEAGQRQLHRAPRTAEIIAGWRRDPSAAALAMRFNAALHALARRGAPPVLQALYRREHEDFEGAVGEALAGADDFIAEWMHHTPQTNEVGRAAAIGAALMEVGQRFGLPFELFEIGSSCGLNLNLHRYDYDLAGTFPGIPGSPVKIAPEWRGEPPRVAPLEVLRARGVDLNPLDPNDATTCERLLSFVWADQPHRAARLEEALAMARQHPPALERGNAIPWIAARLAEPQEAGVCRAVFHSMFIQYLDVQDRRAIIESIHAAGDRATLDRPLAWISLEWTLTRSEVQLSLTCWPSGETRLLATCHPYGEWIDWRG